MMTERTLHMRDGSSGNLSADSIMRYATKINDDKGLPHAQ